jgi:uncharacterized membrane protein
MTVSDIVVIIIFAVTVAVCTARGLAMTLYSTFSAVIAVAGAFLLRPLVSAGLTAAGADNFFTEGIYRQLDAARTEHFQNAAAGTGKELAEALKLPGFLQRFLEDKTGAWTTQSAFESVEREISEAISSLLVNILSVILLILVILLVMFLLRNILSVFSKIPVIKQVNTAAGFLTGLIMAFFWVSVIGLILQLFSASAVFEAAIRNINNSLFAKYFYDTNVFMILLSKL